MGKFRTEAVPPLNALRAFEAAARRQSVTAAATELGVTASAVSHQIRSLEDALGAPLFQRANRRLSLTADGRALLPGLSDGFRSIAAALAEFHAGRRQGVLTVSMVSTLAMRWFLPRLPRFQSAHPDIEVRISTTLRTVDFAREGIDLAIRHGSGEWKGLRADLLFRLETLPVCSPDLARPAAALDTPDDLKKHILLHAQTRPDDWNLWLDSVGQSGLTPARSLTFETTNFALAAAIKGLGVAIADRHIVAEDLQVGRLVAPFAQTLHHDSGYYLVYPATRAAPPKIALFRDWLLGEEP